MVKHNQTIRRQFADELFECVDHFVILALKVLSLPFERKNMFIICIKNIRIYKNKGFLFKFTKSLQKKVIYELLRHLAKLWKCLYNVPIIYKQVN